MNAPSEQTGSRPTERDIAQFLGISQAAVSMALRGVGRVSKECRRKILEAAGKMGYQPNPAAVKMAGYRYGMDEPAAPLTLAWLSRCSPAIESFPHPHFQRCYWEGALFAAEAAGYRLQEFMVHERFPLSRLRDVLLESNVQGVLIPPHPRDANWKGADFRPFAVVKFGHPSIGIESSAVNCDQLGNTALAFHKIRKCGYRRIGFVGEPPGRTMFGVAFLELQLGIAAACQVPPFFRAPMDRASELEKLAAWIKRHQPDAVLTDDANLRAKLEAIGLRVPRHLALASTNVVESDIDAGIDQNTRLVGIAAVDLLVNRIQGDESGIGRPGRTITIPGTWVSGRMLPGAASRRTSYA